ncbi:MAG TPA: hypothetical protein VJ979_00490 [Actinomycetota bacterium]|nr:hypothetical protein [Actinomycetota bacterium]
MIRCSERAVALLRTAEAAARRFNPQARIRLSPGVDGVRFDLVDGPERGDEIVEHEGGFTLFVAPGLVGTVDVADPHDRLVVIPDSGGAGP